MNGQIDDKVGIVYVLKNEAMPGYIKIGKAKELKQRIAGLDTPGIPLPFEFFYARRVPDAAFVEARLHAVFADMRTRKSREFFKVLPERVKAVLEIAPGEEVAIQERSVVESQDDLDSLERAKTKRPPFRFSLVGIAPGTALVHSHDPSATCTVNDDRRILFEGQVMSLSHSAGVVLKRKGLNDQVAGTDYWTRDGVTLWIYAIGLNSRMLQIDVPGKH
jgi:T5orf172 domain